MNSASVMELPATWTALVDAQLNAGEAVLAWLATDLDEALHFAPGLVVLTSQRLLAKTAHARDWQSHPLRTGLQLTRHDHAGVGRLELRDSDRGLARWRYTLAADSAAGRLLDHFDRQLVFRLTGEMSPRDAQPLCPNCETPLLAGQEECPVCSKE
ncbi:MAG: ABC transporter, partial [Propionivibrio sp.]